MEDVFQQGSNTIISEKRIIFNMFNSYIYERPSRASSPDRAVSRQGAVLLIS